MDRLSIALAHIDRSMKILEIGPSYSPLAPRSDGWKSYSLDHLTQDDLRKKYSDRDAAKIERVDFVWKKGQLESAVPLDHRGTFDACIASHVIEHTPDMIAFLDSISSLLRPGGILSLLIPDRRYIFDVFKPSTSVQQILEAHSDKRVRHTQGAAFVNTAYFATNNGEITWDEGKPISDLRLRYTLDEARVVFASHRKRLWFRPAYVDYHNWYFTPARFKLINLDLAVLGLTSFTWLSDFDTYGCEFFVSLKNEPPSLPEDSVVQKQRLELMERALFEEWKHVSSYFGTEQKLVKAS